MLPACLYSPTRFQVKASGVFLPPLRSNCSARHSSSMLAVSTLNCRLSAPRVPSLSRIGKPLSGMLFTNQPVLVPLMLAPSLAIDLPLTSQLEPTLTPVVTIRSDRSAPVLSARMLYAQTLSAQIFSAPMSSAASLCRSDQTEPSHSYLDSI